MIAPPWRRLPLGARGERVAARHLRRLGYLVLCRNLRLTMGEIDLLCRAPKPERTLVVVEVKSRRVDPDGPEQPPPEAAITAAKRRKLLTLAHAVARHKRWGGGPVRIDVVAVEFPPRGRPVVRVHPRSVTG